MWKKDSLVWWEQNCTLWPRHKALCLTAALLITLRTSTSLQWSTVKVASCCGDALHQQGLRNWSRSPEMCKADREISQKTCSCNFSQRRSKYRPLYTNYWLMGWIHMQPTNTCVYAWLSIVSNKYILHIKNVNIQVNGGGSVIKGSVLLIRMSGIQAPSITRLPQLGHWATVSHWGPSVSFLTLRTKVWVYFGLNKLEYAMEEFTVMYMWQIKYPSSSKG